MAEAYCKTDKKMVEVLNPQRITLKNGKPALQGTCPTAAARSSGRAADRLVLAPAALTRRRRGLDNGKAHRRSGDPLDAAWALPQHLVDGHAFQPTRLDRTSR